MTNSRYLSGFDPWRAALASRGGAAPWGGEVREPRSPSEQREGPGQDPAGDQGPPAACQDGPEAGHVTDACEEKEQEAQQQQQHPQQDAKGVAQPSGGMANAAAQGAAWSLSGAAEFAAVSVAFAVGARMLYNYYSGEGRHGARDSGAPPLGARLPGRCALRSRGGGRGSGAGLNSHVAARRSGKGLVLLPGRAGASRVGGLQRPNSRPIRRCRR